MLVVVAHQHRAGRERAFGLEPEHRRDALLIFERELIEVAFAQEVERVADAKKKVACLQNLAQLRGGDNRALNELFDRMDFVFDLGQP